MSGHIIGGSDGPTSIFLAGTLEPDWINIFGLVIIVLLLIPNIIYAIRHQQPNREYTSNGINLLEQIGRYACMFFMIFPIGIAEFGFPSISSFLIYGIGNTVLIIAYWIIWIFYFRQKTLRNSMALAILPTGIFLLSGITLMHILLIVSAVVFGISHIYITCKSVR